MAQYVGPNKSITGTNKYWVASRFKTASSCTSPSLLQEPPKD